MDVPRTVTCNEGEQGSATGDTLTCDTTVPQSFCPPGTFNGPDSPNGQFCNYRAVDGDDPCPYGDEPPDQSGICQSLRNSEGQCWGTAVDSGTGQCITDSRTISCNEGEQGAPSTDSAGLICTTPGVDVPRTVTCDEGEQGSATGDTLTWTTPGVDVPRTVTCDEGEQGAPST